ncbi:hypothetical protein CD58_16870 [Pseudomonas brassicacearum]|nr:hypothetical protein CD58_16870 [Pseudomonas brassicacearum]
MLGNLSFITQALTARERVFFLKQPPAQLLEWLGVYVLKPQCARGLRRYALLCGNRSFSVEVVAPLLWEFFVIAHGAWIVGVKVKGTRHA